MPDFQPYVPDWTAARQDVSDLKALLDSSADIDEKTFDTFFKSHAHVRALVGMTYSALACPDLLAWQYPIFGDFRCDFAIGDSARKAFTFVEYEDAGPNSLFVKQGKKATRAWSPRFDSGYSQIVDWFYKLQAMTNTPDMETRFGKRSIRYAGVLIVGRDQHLKAGEAMRLEWRRDHVIVNSKYIYCFTYDELVADLLLLLEKVSSEKKVSEAAAPAEPSPRKAKRSP